MGAPPASYFRKNSRLTFGKLLSNEDTSAFFARRMAAVSALLRDCASENTETISRKHRLSIFRRMQILDTTASTGRLNVNGCRDAVEHYSVFTNFTHTGAPTSTIFPVGVSWPVLASMRKTTMLSDFWFAAKRNLPVGSISKLRGSLPPV